MSACQFVSRHQPLALYLAGGMTSNRDEAEDLAQEVLCRALKNWRWLDQKRTLSPWLRAVMKNAFIDSRRKADRSRCVSIEAPVQDGRAIGDFLAAGDSLPEDELLRREEVMNVRRVLARLRPAHRRALAICDMDGESYDNASRTLGIKLGTFRSRLFRARAAFRRQWSLAGGGNHV